LAEFFRPLRRKLGFIAVLLGLLVAGIYVSEVIRCSQYKPTGDALYDQYARTVIARNRWRLFHNRNNGVTYLPDSLLETWEPEFGDDPHYWQLRWFCAKHKQAPRIVNISGARQRLPTDPQLNAWQHLQEGVDRGAADWATWALLIREPGRAAVSSIDDELEQARNSSPDPRTQQQAVAAVLARYEQIELNELDSMVEADVHQAWPYYLRAKYWMEYGELDNAIEDLKKGNHALCNELEKPFPVAFLLDRISAGDHLGSDIVAGAILEDDAWSAMPNWIKWKDHYKEAQLVTAMSGDLELTQQLHIAACRLGEAEHGSSIESSVAAVLFLMEAKELISGYSQDLSDEQRMTAWSIDRRGKGIQNYWVSWYAEVWPWIRDYPRLHMLLTMVNVVGIGSESVVEPPGGADPEFSGESIMQYLLPRRHYLRSLWLREQQVRAIDDLRGYFEELEQADLRTLEWPDDWGVMY